MPDPAPYGTAPSQPQAGQKPGLEQAYASLQALLCASPRGGWFLAEYLRRNRSAETDMLLEALGRIERAVTKPAAKHGPAANVFAELVEMSEAIARTRREIAQIRPPYQFDRQLVSATEELDHIVGATEKATSDILQAAEEIQEVAWTLREKGTGAELCDKIDSRATDIYTACSFQDLTGQRTEKVVKALRFIEQRINAMIEIWGVDDIAYKVDDIAGKMQEFAAQMREETSPHLHGPQATGQGLKQDDVDRMLRVARGQAAAAEEAALAERTASPPEPSPEAAVPVEETGEPAANANFERPEPLAPADLDAIKRVALFG